MQIETRLGRKDENDQQQQQQQHCKKWKELLWEIFFLNTLIVSGLAKRGDTPDAQSPCPL